MIASKKEYKDYLAKDLISSGFNTPESLTTRIKTKIFRPEELKFIRSLRYLEYCENVLKRNGIIGLLKWGIAKYRFHKLSLRLGYSIPINVFGPGLSLPHRGNIIINPNVRVGENCRIHVGVNIGAHNGKAPLIGNNVYIGPGAILFGDIEIADNISIGANATVNKSFLDSNVAIAGTPAKIVKTNTVSWNGK